MTKRKTSLSLPPEILFEIFQDLDVPRATISLDLLACSLVCSSWHPVALSFIVTDLAHIDLRHYDLAEIRRLAELLEFSQAHRITPPGVVQSVHLSVYYDHNQFSVPKPLAKPSLTLYTYYISQCILSLPPFRRLSMDFPSLNSPQAIIDITVLLSQIRRSAQAQSIEELNGVRIHHASFNKPIADLLNSLPNLQVIYLLVTTRIDREMAQALGNCRQVRYAELECLKCAHDETAGGASTPESFSILTIPHWLNLHTFQLSDGACVHAMPALLQSLERHCLHLAYIQLGPPICHPTEAEATELATALASLVFARRSTLTKLDLVCHGYISDDHLFLPTLFGPMPALEELLLYNIGYVTGTNIALPEWPKLRYLSLPGCLALLPQFVVDVVGVCSLLEGINLPSTMINVDFAELGWERGITPLQLQKLGRVSYESWIRRKKEP